LQNNEIGMSYILNKLLSVLAPRRREYLTIDRDFNILETSVGVRRFADSEALAALGAPCPNEIKMGKDVRDFFPELIGLEDTLSAIFQGSEPSFELKGIGRFSPQGTPLYLDLYVIKNQYEKKSENRLIIFFEDVTERMVLEQTLVQASNEKSLLLSALAASKAYVDKIITSMADALLVTTPSGIIKTVNRATQDLFGYSEEELIGKSISLIISEEKLLLECGQPPLLYHESLNNVEVVCQTKTGEKVAIAFSCSAIQTDIEDLQNFIYIGRDITERHRTQKRLAAQYSITRILSESGTLKETPLKILQAICENLGWDVGELWTPGRYFGETATEDTGNPVFTVLRCVEMWVQPSVVIPEFISLTKQTTFAAGEGLPGHVWATCSPHWSSDVAEDSNFVRKESAFQAGLHGAFGFPIQGDSEILGVMTFYSREVQRLDEGLLKAMAAIGNQLGQFIKRKQAEAALAESEERYRDLFENASDLIQCCGLNGQFVYVNRAWREALGYSEAQVAQLNLFDIIHPDCRAHYLETFSRVLSGENIAQVKAAFINKNGKKISVEGNINCKFVGGKPVATRAIFRDITERLQTEQALQHQQEQTERLLLNILPEPIADRLKQETSTIAENFAEVSVMFADIVGFTQLASSLNPIELVDLLNQIFSAFDRLSEKHGLEKIKTVGDAYMVVGGLPTRRADHAEAIAEMALDMQATIAQFRNKTGQQFNIRIGINTGPVVAGVIGIKKFSYDLWGDTVNIASRMESHGLSGQIQLTAATYERLRDQYLFEERGVIQVKGKGEMTTYLLIGRKIHSQAIC
jgi:PAS domain S-box-containing protein